MNDLISVIVPVYNTAPYLKRCLHSILTNTYTDLEIICVDDGSTDDTVKVAKKWGVDHIVSFPRNRGLAKGFMAGLDGCLRNGADIIVNTDADNQYCADDIEKLIAPILSGEAEIVIGARPIDKIDHFSRSKKILQHIGSWAVRRASGTDIPDAPSGFRAMTADVAMRLNVLHIYLRNNSAGRKREDGYNLGSGQNE